MPKAHLDRLIRGVPGRFLELATCRFTDERGREREWESVRRVNGTGAVMILALTAAEPRSVVLVRQFRPPAGRYMLELPAGLIDPGENPEDAARRELYEETGFSGRIERILPAAFTSPGMSGETIITVEMTVDHRPGDPLPPTHQEDSECIEVFAVPIAELDDFCARQYASGVGIDAKLLLLSFR